MRNLLFALSAVGLMACADGGTDDFTHPSLDLTGDSAAGEQVYTSTCSSCHGADGTGGTGSDLTAVLSGQTDAEITQTLVEGISGTSMVSYDSILSDQEMADVVAYISQWAN